jgi:hypothetical protein
MAEYLVRSFKPGAEDRYRLKALETSSESPQLMAW